MEIRPVGEAQWPIVEWLWQAYRNEMAPIVNGYPRPDGRYGHDPLDVHPGSEAHAGFLAWQPHPHRDEETPVGFATVDGIGGERRSITGFWTVPMVRRTGVGRRLALDVIERYAGPWAIAFQHDNVGAGAFWREVATAAFGAGGWTEEEIAVPNHPGVPPDHWIITR